MVTTSFENRTCTKAMGKCNMHSRPPTFFFILLEGWGLWGKDFSFLWGVLMCSHVVPQWVFPIAPNFKPICFAQSPPLLTYIGGPNGRTLWFSNIESFNLGGLHTSNFFSDGQILLTYNLASLGGPNSARARTHLTLSLMKQFKSNRLTLH